jgi:hypothetical protein
MKKIYVAILFFVVALNVTGLICVAGEKCCVAECTAPHALCGPLSCQSESPICCCSCECGETHSKCKAGSC